MRPPLFRRLLGGFLFAAAIAAPLVARANAQEKTLPLPGPESETILSTYHVKIGQEKAFLAAVTRTWAIYRRLDVVLPQPHTLVSRVDDAGHTLYYELFTWRSGDIPDNAPPEIKAAWKDLEALCKLPDGKSGIEGEEVTVAAMD
jgi:hypothetical protein